MLLKGFSKRVADDVPGMGYFHCRTVGDEEKLSSFNCGFIEQDAVFGDAHAIESRAQRAEPADHEGPFQGSHDGTDERTRHD